MNGIILLNKPEGITSFRAGNRVRGFLTRVTGAKHKVGHTGTLDPMATGVLPLLIDGAARFAQYLPEHGKAYRAVLRLGVTTDTLDRTGRPLLFRQVTCGRSDVERALQGFVGEIEQLPPMFSAVSVGGVRLYELARRGEEIERKTRRITIHTAQLVDADEAAGDCTIDVTCSAGTYIRTLAADLGEVLGCGAHLIALTRTMANGFALAGCVTQEELEVLWDSGTKAADEFFVPITDALAAYPAVTVTAAQAVRFGNGGALDRDRAAPVPDGLCRVFSPDAVFLGLALADGGELKAERILPKTTD
ncbi:MAG: tRNA pseudouridine(55) synthase TruB [Oscillospiraceae bacterium]|jgi:tRNA pseudouridine55 synthase|nr:tRNA pseudouridine(55) synthase TruB [Oscillospiraceae bacterium]